MKCGKVNKIRKSEKKTQSQAYIDAEEKRNQISQFQLMNQNGLVLAK